MPEWDLEAVTAKWQERWWEARVHHAERPKDAVVPWWEAKEAAKLVASAARSSRPLAWHFPLRCGGSTRRVPHELPLVWSAGLRS